MQSTTLIENGDGAGGGQYHVMGQPQAGSAGGAAPGAQSCQCHGHRGQQGVGVEPGGPQSEPVVKFGNIRLGFEDVFLILIALQTLGVVVDLIGEVRS